MVVQTPGVPIVIAPVSRHTVRLILVVGVVDTQKDILDLKAVLV
jgi:hypothetical protein